MTRLDRTPLKLSEKIDCAARALAAQDRYGTISDLSRELGISRPTLYEARDAASLVLEAHFKQPEGIPVPYEISVEKSPVTSEDLEVRSSAC